ncbi:MAG: AMP-binding protein [Thermoplasmatales archaeon]|nr:AMP-binding protein [Thermoplasmatales archaeon]MCW6170397.1 AMP-binding protein [Thermoplasmatales archaeon]
MTAIELLRMMEETLLRDNKEIFLFYDKSYRSREIVKMYRSVAKYLSSRGIGKGDVVAIDLLNRPELLIIVMGSWMAGATVTPINVHLKEQEISYQIKDSGAKIIFGELAYGERIEKAIEKSGISVEKVIMDFDKLDLSNGIYQTVFNGESDDTSPSFNPEDLFIIYTSGTTGEPKGVVLSSTNIFTEAIQLQLSVSMQKSDRMIVILPLFHVNNLMFSIASILKGGSLVILRKFDPDEFFENVEKYQPTLFSGVPTIFKMLSDLASPDHKVSLSSLKIGICGAAPMPVKWFENFEKFYGIKIIEGYGMTEGTVASTINPRFGERKVGSIGIPLPGQDVRVFSDNDENLPPGEIGEIVIRGPNVMKGYLNRKLETEETLRNGWLHSGDLGYMDKEGYFFIVDRKKDMIIRGGENVYPKEIENLINTLPEVSEVAVVGRSDDKYGEEVVAFIVKKNENLTESEVIEFCKSRIAWYKCPKSVFFLNELPKNSVGKIQKNDLRKLLNYS